MFHTLITFDNNRTLACLVNFDTLKGIGWGPIDDVFDDSLFDFKDFEGMIPISISEFIADIQQQYPNFTFKYLQTAERPTRADVEALYPEYLI